MGLNALSGAFECKSKKTWDDSNYYVVHWFSNNLDSLDGLNGFNRQPSKKVIFTVNRQKFQVISNLTISPDLNGLLARGGEGGTAIYGLYRYVPLWRVWFSSSLL